MITLLKFVQSTAKEFWKLNKQMMSARPGQILDVEERYKHIFRCFSPITYHGRNKMTNWTIVEKNKMNLDCEFVEVRLIWDVFGRFIQWRTKV